MIDTNTIRARWDEFVTQGDQKSYEELYQHYFHYLSYIGLKKGFDASTVKDCINESFLYFWERRSELDHICHAHNYIITVFMRKVYREEKLKISTDEITNVLDEADFSNIFLPTVIDNLVNKENTRQTSRLLRIYLEQLPPRQREIIYQKFYLGLSYQEIAKSSGLSVNTVYNTLYNAMDKLRSLLPKSILFSIIPFLPAVCKNIF